MLRSLFVEPLVRKVSAPDASFAKASGNNDLVTSVSGYKSNWHILSDGEWDKAGINVPDLQNWCISTGKLVCLKPGLDQMGIITSHAFSSENENFQISLELNFKEGDPAGPLARAGVCIHEHIYTGVDQQGYLFINSSKSSKNIQQEVLQSGLRLVLKVKPLSDGASYAKLIAMDGGGLTLLTLHAEQFTAEDWSGPIALFAGTEGSGDASAVYFSQLNIEGERLKLLQAN